MRKPEYPLDFVYRNWAAYLEMQKLTERMIVILPGSVDDVEREIWRLTLDACIRLLMRVRAGLFSQAA